MISRVVRTTVLRSDGCAGATRGSRIRSRAPIADDPARSEECRVRIEACRARSEECGVRSEALRAQSEECHVASKSVVFGPKCFVFGPKRFALGPKSVVFDPKCFVFGPKRFALGPKSVVFDPKCFMFGPKRFALGPKSVVFDPKCFMFDSKCLVFGSKTIHFRDPLPKVIRRRVKFRGRIIPGIFPMFVQHFFVKTDQMIHGAVHCRRFPNPGGNLHGIGGVVAGDSSAYDVGINGMLKGSDAKIERPQAFHIRHCHHRSDAGCVQQDHGSAHRKRFESGSALGKNQVVVGQDVFGLTGGIPDAAAHGIQRYPRARAGLPKRGQVGVFTGVVAKDQRPRRFPGQRTARLESLQIHEVEKQTYFLRRNRMLVE